MTPQASTFRKAAATRFLFLASTLSLLAAPAFFGNAQCPGNVSPVPYHPLPHSHIGISATVNGSGPYEFMVDTGAQIAVIEPSLAGELKLKAAGSLNIVTVVSNVEVPLVSAAVVEIGPVSVEGIQMAVEDLGPIQADYPRLRGILGNNFLGRFDLLIDHRHRMLCFDGSRQMQESLRGEHVPILSKADSHSAPALRWQSSYQPTCPMTAPEARSSGLTPARTFPSFTRITRPRSSRALWTPW